MANSIQEILFRSYQLASHRYHELVTLEHMLAALLEGPDIQSIIEKTHGDLVPLLESTLNYLDNPRNHVVVRGTGTYNPKHTPLVANVVKKAKAQSMFNGRSEPSNLDLLLAMYGINESHASYFLEEFGPSKEEILDYLNEESEGPSTTTTKTGNEALEQYCVNLNHKATQGKIDPLIGREREVESISQILSRRKKNNVIMVGPPGVGKTVIMEGLAKRIVDKDVPECLANKTIYSLDISAMLAGTKFRGDFEERMKALIAASSQNPDVILFIDEIHMIMGAGNAGSSSGTIDAANMLKPALGRGEINCVGSTTHEEYKKHFEKDRALVRRFQQIDINEPSIEDSKKIVRGLIKFYSEYHNVTYAEDAIDAAVELTAQHVNDKFLPDKAIDVIDSAGAWQKIKPELERIKFIERAQIEAEISRVAKIPTQTLVKSDVEKLQDLEINMQQDIFGQDHAVKKLIDAVLTSSSGLRESEKTLGSFLFAGPTGVGKTQIAKQLAATLGIKFIRFDMSEYQEKHSLSKLIGSPPGYVGYSDGGAGSGLLINEIQKNPHCVLLFDEIEKSHPDISNLFLQLMDDGTLTSSDGKSVTFRHAYVIFTTNLGAQDMEKNRIGFTNNDSSHLGTEAINKFFAPEFRNRLDSIITFNKLKIQDMHHILNKFIKELNVLSSKKNVVITLDTLAEKHLIKLGFTENMGARPLSRVIHENIKQPLAREILFGKLKHGGEVLISESQGQLTFEYKKQKEQVGTIDA